MTLPITVIIVTKNEEKTIEQCLQALTAFDDIIVVDSNSADKTKKLAAASGARVVNFTWNGAYPKKRQWCLDTLGIKHDFVFFVDADEVVTKALVEELQLLFPRMREFSQADTVRSTPARGQKKYAGYFIRGRYVINGRALKYGLHNNKLCLINRHKIEFPVVDDLDIDGMGEIEGHYQPVLKTAFQNEPLAQVHEPLLHHAQITGNAWQGRHLRYAHWHAEVHRRGALPSEDHRGRAIMKTVFNAAPRLRAFFAFMHSYVLKFGFLDGRAGFALARSRYRYYRMIERAVRH